MKKIISFFLALAFCHAGISQAVLSGIVVDAETKLPLEGASVFAQNTTSGTITKADGSYRLSLGKGGYELIFSYTGYVTDRMNIEATDNKTVDVALKKEDKSMTEVVIMSSNEVLDGWEKHGQFFLDHFIGTTPFAKRTTLVNPEALKFFYYRRTDKLKVLATEPLKIADSALGYDLQYALDSFVHYNKTGISSYRGNCLYLPMEGDLTMREAWNQARQEAYYGSRLHFLRSYYDSTLKQQGFTVDILSDNSLTKFNRLRNPYDTAYYFADDSTGDVELWFPKKASITYHNKKPDASYLAQMGLPADVKAQMSYVDLLDAIIVKPNGYFIEQRSWINQGYWSWKNVADLLPYDYEPGR